MSIVIFEDEIYNFQLLRHQLVDINPDYDVIGPISTVEEGRAFLSYHHDIDLIIADIQLNDGLSFDALSYASEDIPIIFTTAYDEYALKAFEYNSLSYLLKPIDDDELRKAISKALRINSKSIDNSKFIDNSKSIDNSKFKIQNSKLDLSQDSNHKVQSSKFKVQSNQGSKFKVQSLLSDIALDSTHRHCFLVKTPRGSRRVHVSMVRYAVSENKTTYIHLLDGATYPVDIALTDLAVQLDQKQFMRVNRKFILPLEQVKGIEHLPNGRIQIILYGSDSPEIIVSRDMRKSVMEWIAE